MEFHRAPDSVGDVRNFLTAVTQSSDIRHGQVISYRTNSGAARFQVRFPAERSGFGYFTLSSNDDCTKDLYKILLAYQFSGIVDVTKNPKVHKVFTLPEPLNAEYCELWITWYNNKIKLGVQGQTQPFLEYEDESIRKNNIGHINFHRSLVNFPVDWIFEAPPPIIREMTRHNFEDGQLCWREMEHGYLPSEAMIGGFEDEPIYIARAKHQDSLCPGKFVPSKQLAFVAWGHRAHSKNVFEILCGYNARWVKTNGNSIPDNAFVAGYSEVNRGPLYVGRAMIENNLICGKVHVNYKACYLPYNEKEVEVYSYEILVTPYVTSRGILCGSTPTMAPETVGGWVSM